MTRKKIDNRIRVLIENCISTLHRSLFVVVGPKARDQVVDLYQMLIKAAVRARPNVLWCYKKELGFSFPKKERIKKLKKKLKSGTKNINEEDPFEVFMASTKVRFCHYGETQQVLGQTFGMLILQDFEALTPNLLARTVETVEGGGIIVILLPSITSLRQLYTMPMDVHARYKTEAHRDVTCRFNERFVLSLLSCPDCLIVDDKLDVLPCNTVNIKPLRPKTENDVKSPSEQELLELQESFQDTQPVGALISQCRTLDQAKALLKFIDALSEKKLRTTVALTSARGRGKSAALGLCVASAIAFNYSNIFVTSPSPENLNTFFLFLFKGFDSLGYEDHTDYEVVQSVNPEFNNAIVRVNVFRDHRQTVQYIHPTDADKLGQAELVVIDEAAAIPLPFVKSLLGPHLVFMASTVNGYEGTGRSLSLKLINQLRKQAASVENDMSKTSSVQSSVPPMGRSLHEVTLNESIRYQSGDNVEDWLNRLLCLDASVVPRLHSGCPEPRQCQLYYISRDSLLSYEKTSEEFLQRILALFVSSHYKNSPNDLHMLADAPAHHLFCLLPPFEASCKILPEVLCAIQVCLEGKISKKSVLKKLSRGKQAAGDLIPWTISQQFQDQDFPSLSGARIVRIATHPDYQRMGYGLHALQLLQEYYEGKVPTIDELPNHVLNGSHTEEFAEENLQPRKSVPRLLLKLTQRRPEALDYIGVSYGLTGELLRFWKKAGFVPTYLRQTPNDLTGEHSCIMLKALDTECGSSNWLSEFFADFRERYISLLGYQFSSFLSSVALSVIANSTVKAASVKELTKKELDLHVSAYSIKRLEMYCQNLADYHLIVDLVPTLARLYFLNHLGELSLTSAQTAILFCMGLQHKSVDQIATELELKSSQILGLFNRTIRRLTQRITGIVEKAVEKTLLAPRDISMLPVDQTLEQELREAAKEIEVKQKIEAKKLQDMDFSEYAIKGSEEDWQKAAIGSQKTLVSIKRINKSGDPGEEISYKRKQKHQKNKKDFKKHKTHN